MSTRCPILTACLIAPALAIAMMPGATTTLWFDREAIGSGQIVRLFTCH